MKADDQLRALGHEIAQRQFEASINEIFRAPRVKPAYCDFIADRIARALKASAANDSEAIVAEVGRVQWDLHPTEGYFVSPKKTIEVTDRNGKQYRVTVEEIERDADTRPCDSERGGAA